MSDFCSDPQTYYTTHFRPMQHLPRTELEAAQLATLRSRFAALRQRIAPLTAMADQLGVDAIGALEDVVPLLFPHSFYKAYPTSLLDRRDFDAMTRWLGRLTVHDLSPVLGGEYHSIDAWLAAMDERTPVRVCHSSGTSGGFSLSPHGKWERDFSDYRLSQAGLLRSRFADDELGQYEDPARIIVPTYAGGRSGILRFIESIRVLEADSGSQLIPLIPNEMSTDWLYHTVRQNDATQRGVPLDLEITPYLQARLDEHEQMIVNFPRLTDTALRRIYREARGRKVMLSGAPIPLYQMACEGIVRGMENMFAPGSLIVTYGGGKGHQLPDDVYEVIQRFAGPAEIVFLYGVTEMLGGVYACPHERYHFQPSIIPYCLDVATGQPLPRQGIQRGRGAYFDLMTQSTWGGLISGDLVEMSWEPCACGRTTAHIGFDIARCAPVTGNEHAIGATSLRTLEAGLAALNGHGIEAALAH